MRHRYLAPLGALAVVLTLVSVIVGTMVSQAPARQAPAQTAAPAQTSAPAKPALPKPGPAPKTAWGEPDLQGTWFGMESVPLERSAANANKPLLTDAEVEAADKQKSAAPGRNARSENGAQDVEGAYN